MVGKIVVPWFRYSLKSKMWMRTPKWARNLWIRFTDPKRYHYKQRQIKVSQQVRDAYRFRVPGELTMIKPDGTKVTFKN